MDVAPSAEHVRRRAEAGARVDDCRAAHAASERQRYRRPPLAGREPAVPVEVGQRVDRIAFGLARRRAVDHGAQRRIANLAHDRGCLLDRVDETGEISRQRLDAIADMCVGGRIRDHGETFDPALAAVVLIAGIEHALLG